MNQPVFIYAMKTKKRIQDARCGLFYVKNSNTL